MSRRIAREMALQALFQMDVFRSVQQNLYGETGVDFAEFTVEAALGAAFEEHEGDNALKAQDYAEHLVRGVLEQREAIDAKLSEYAIDWTVERMSGTDRNILRIALYEMLFSAKPMEAGIAINEAVELAKAYGTDDSSKFVNGVLGKISRAK